MDFGDGGSLLIVVAGLLLLEQTKIPALFQQPPEGHKGGSILGLVWGGWRHFYPPSFQLIRFASRKMTSNEAPSAPPVVDARTSTALISFVKVCGDGNNNILPLGTVTVRLHSDLVPAGVQNFVSRAHRSADGGYIDAAVRLREDRLGLQCGESCLRGYEWEPYWREGKNQHHFPHNERGIYFCERTAI